jgi:hypothetical protein
MRGSFQRGAAAAAAAGVAVDVVLVVRDGADGRVPQHVGPAAGRELRAEDVQLLERR